MLFLPPVGWILALGVRSIAAIRLVDGHASPIPHLSDCYLMALRRGLAALGVIVAYLAPFLAAYWILGVDSRTTLRDHMAEFLFFMVACLAFPPLFVPTLPFVYAHRFPWLEFSSLDITVLALLFVVPVFVLPAAFSNVAIHNSFPAAFRIRAAVTGIAARPRLYLEAWLASLLISALAVLTGPAAPWALAWSYLIILHLFLDATAHWPQPEVQSRFERSTLRCGQRPSS